MWLPRSTLETNITRHLSMCGECFHGSIRRGYREEQPGPARRPRSHYRLVGSAAPSTLLEATIWAVRRHAIVVHLVAAQTARVTDRPRLVDTGWFGLVEDLVGGHPPTHSPDERRISSRLVAVPADLVRSAAEDGSLRLPALPLDPCTAQPRAPVRSADADTSQELVDGPRVPKILIAATLSPGHPARADARANDSTRPAAPPLPLKNTRVKHTCLVTVCLVSFGAQMPANRHVADQTGPPARRTRAIDAPFCKGFGGEYGPHRGKRQLKWSRCYSTTTTWANAAITAAL